MEANKDQFELLFIDETLSVSTASLAAGCKGVSLFTSDDASAKVLELLKEQHIEFIATHSAGYDHIDLAKAAILNLKAANVTEYSPHAIAEHAVAKGSIEKYCRHYISQYQLFCK